MECKKQVKYTFLCKKDKTQKKIKVSAISINEAKYKLKESGWVIISFLDAE